MNNDDKLQSGVSVACVSPDQRDKRGAKRRSLTVVLGELCRATVWVIVGIVHLANASVVLADDNAFTLSRLGEAVNEAKTVWKATCKVGIAISGNCTPLCPNPGNKECSGITNSTALHSMRNEGKEWFCTWVDRMPVARVEAICYNRQTTISPEH